MLIKRGFYQHYTKNIIKVATKPILNRKNDILDLLLYQFYYCFLLAAFRISSVLLLSRRLYNKSVINIVAIPLHISHVRVFI